MNKRSLRNTNVNTEIYHNDYANHNLPPQMQLCVYFCACVRVCVLLVCVCVCVCFYLYAHRHLLFSVFQTLIVTEMCAQLPHVIKFPMRTEHEIHYKHLNMILYIYESDLKNLNVAFLLQQLMLPAHATEERNLAMMTYSVAD